SVTPAKSVGQGERWSGSPGFPLVRNDDSISNDHALWPRGFRRQRHQDRLDIAAGLQPEAGAAVVQQVELDIAPAPDQLMATLFRRPRPVHPLPNDGGIDLEKRLADTAAERKIALPVAAVEIIEKDAAGAARLVAMWQEEILVAPFLEP